MAIDARSTDFATPVLALAGRFSDELSSTIGDHDLTTHRVGIQSGVDGALASLRGIDAEIAKVNADLSRTPEWKRQRIAELVTGVEGDVERHLGAADEALTQLRGELDRRILPTFEGSPDQELLVRHEVERIFDRAKDPHSALLALARDPRYAGVVAGPGGRALLMERGQADMHGSVQRAAMEWAVQHGTDGQRRAAARRPATIGAQKALVAARNGARMKLASLRPRR